ncbi:MAG TPA: sulfotransferase domain-containing protein [Phenylobacterium sp.]|nr:sulfotransferase domain-containing protein [Phenylobacterium sp.]
MAEPPRVDFVIAGVQKAGTTALFDYLAEASDIALSRVKETHFFDDDTLDWAAPDYRAYHAHFDDPAGRICGEATPIYLYWPNALERMAAYNPGLRIIVVLRDPVERAWSHWRMEYARGAEREPFAWSIRQGRQRLFEATPWGVHREFSYVERGFYGEQVARLFGLFPKTQALFLRAEDLRADPAAALASVRGFLGLPRARPPAARDVHVGQDIDYGSELTQEDAHFLRGVYARDQARLEALTGIRFG